ncbi:unnamed protein product [Darwinula stevensoni]|uniref:Uncharacterized protein n=1 Tax=Darwinula stevensoni TaxID=69355 RepID=A0A7R9AA99_9CRUS|nr:unnamed protein product [Darwinula stevensoni]CAG0898061.1 unnamed protein product [Darwinula stevensoni]
MQIMLVPTWEEAGSWSERCMERRWIARRIAEEIARHPKFKERGIASGPGWDAERVVRKDLEQQMTDTLTRNEGSPVSRQFTPAQDCVREARARWSLLRLIDNAWGYPAALAMQYESREAGLSRMRCA